MQKGDIPKWAKSVLIYDTTRVVLEEGAISGLTSLVNFTLKHIDQLELREGAMTSSNDTSSALFQAVLFENIRSLNVSRRAFSGVWRSITTISMQRVGDLYVDSNAFEYLAALHSGPSLALGDIGMLHLETDGLSAPIFDLKMNNVTMEKCKEGSFGGNSMFIQWKKVKINEMESRCFHGSNDFAFFAIEYLRVNTVHPMAFSGKLNELNIQDSKFNITQEQAINLNASTIRIIRSSFEEMRPHALDVLIKEMIWIGKSTIRKLGKDAFLGVRTDRGEGRNPIFTLSKLDVLRSEPGSLAFPTCTKVRLIRLSMSTPWPRICPTYRWAQALSPQADGGSQDKLTPVQYQLFFQLFRRRMCLVDDITNFPALAESPVCS